MLQKKRSECTCECHIPGNNITHFQACCTPDIKEKDFILAIDFDGTIAELSFPEVGEMRPEADIYINKLYDEGCKIIINTCRSGIYEGLAQNFLIENKINYHYINGNLPSLIEYYKQDCRKISADIYIDDKCLMGLPKTWKEIYDIVNKKRSKINETT